MIFATPSGDYEEFYKEILKSYEDSTTFQGQVSIKILESLLKGSMTHVDHFRGSVNTLEELQKVFKAFEEIGSLIENHPLRGAVHVSRINEKDTAEILSVFKKTPVKV